MQYLNSFSNRWLCISLFLFSCEILNGQSTLTKLITPKDSVNKTRLACVSSGYLLGTTGTIIALSSLWYNKYDKSAFHIFNDTKEWMQMDKGGHLVTAYNFTRIFTTMNRWAGIPSNQATWLGAGQEFLFHSTVEILDGFNKGWGFSLGDITSNCIGSATFVTQSIVWKEQRIQLKTSNQFPTPPEDLVLSTGNQETSLKNRWHQLYGNKIWERMNKDYNGLTYWISVNPSSFMDHKASWMPSWLNIAFGYGANNLYGASSNAWIDPNTGQYYILDPIKYPRYRQYFLSLDIDMNKLPFRSPWVKTLFSALSWLKVPAPTLEFTSKGDIRFYPIYW